MYPHLFSPITINKTKIKNRIAYPALGLLYSFDSKLNDRYYNFYKERAAGGAGIVTIGPVGVDFLGSGFLALSLADDSAIGDFEKLTKIIRDEGAVSWIQLFHAGRYSHPILINMETPMGPSPVYSPYSKATPREMTKDDIRAVQKAFVDAALRAKKAGFDGVEVIGSAGYLITQFLSPVTNLRQDEYGGSFENRVRFPREVIEKIREAVGPDYPMTIRMAGNDFIPGSNTEVEARQIAQVYEKAGVDALNVTGGWHETKVPQLPMELPRAGYAFLALNVKTAVNIPVMASNRIAAPDLAETIIREGYADMVNLGRVLIADAYWPQKAKEGRADEIRPCVACSQGCTDQVFSGKPVYCIGNPRASFEAERNIVKTASPKKVLVAGAGPGGLEAAVTAAQIGHNVEIFEKADDIGGQLWIAGAPPGKHDLWDFIRYYRAMLKKHNIPVHLNTEVTLELIKREKPDHVIVAEGAKSLEPPIKGLNDACVLNAWDVLKNSPPLGKKVAVIGGGSVGLETALFVAHRGTLTPEVLYFLFAYDAIPPERLKKLMFQGASQVTVYEMIEKAGKDVGKSTKWVLFDNLSRYNIRVNTKSRVLSIDCGQVTIEKDGEKVVKYYDNVILAAGAQSVKTLAKQLEESNIPMTAIGDGARIGKIGDAIHGGFLAAVNIK